MVIHFEMWDHFKYSINLVDTFKPLMTVALGKMKSNRIRQRIVFCSESCQDFKHGLFCHSVWASYIKVMILLLHVVLHARSSINVYVVIAV